MDIVQEKIDALNTIVKVKLTPEDYNGKIDEKLADYKKKMQMPGFRKGKVPTGHIKKLYGKSILVDEINQILSKSIDSYIKDNNLNVLGQPLPKEEAESANTWELGEEFNFAYEMGLAPDIEVSVSTKDKIFKYDVQIDSKTFDERLKAIRRSYGKFSETEEIHDEDVFQVDLKQLDNEGNFIENGIQHVTNLRMEQIKDKKVVKDLLGLKKDDVYTTNLYKMLGKDTTKLASLLHINEEQAKDAKTEFQIVILKIYDIAMADVNQELFDKVFGPDEVKTEEDFKARLTEDLKKVMGEQSDKQLELDIQDYFIKKMKIELPDTFLKKWIRKTNDPEKVTDEIIDYEYGEFSKRLRWSLIEEKITKEQKIEVGQEEIVAVAKEKLFNQFKLYNQQELDDETLNQYANQLLQDREQVTQVYEEARKQKVLTFVKGEIAIKVKPISYNEFSELK
ncbi:MAG: trigger factor [Sphingobacteriales bacterium]|jgi:trigger factor